MTLHATNALPLDGGGLGGGDVSGCALPYVLLHPTPALSIKGREKS